VFRFFLIIFNLLFIIHSYCQEKKATLSFQATFPQGEYKQVYPVTATGLKFGITQQLKKSQAISVGAELGILQVSGKNKNYTGYYNNEYNTFVVASWNHIITLATLFRANLLNHNKPWNLFVDVSFGTNLFITTTSISRDIPDPFRDRDRVEYFYTDNHASFTFRAGTGIGIEIPFGRMKKVAALLKGSYLYGTHADYYAKPIINNTQIILFPRNSKTTMLLLEAGVRFNLHKKEKKEEN
jgi:hypothetical protein